MNEVIEHFFDIWLLMWPGYPPIVREVIPVLFWCGVVSFFYVIRYKRLIIFILFFVFLPVFLILPFVAIVKLLIWIFSSSNIKLPKRSKPFHLSDMGFELGLTDGSKLNIQNPQRGVLITGGAGAGKSQSIIIPLIYQSVQKNYTGILYDYENPVLANHVWTAFRNNQNTKNEIKITDYYVNFTDLNRSHRLNPLDPRFMTSSSYAREYSTTILANLNPEAIQKKDFWIRSAEVLFAAVQWYLREEHPNYCTLPHAVSLILTDDIPKLLDLISVNDECAGMVTSIKAGLKSENQTAGVLATVQNSIANINTPEIFWVLSGNDLTLDLNNPADPKFLTIGNEPSLVDTYSPVISLMISAALKLINRQNQQHSIILIDELPTVYIPNLERLPATARKNKVATVLCVQDFSQLEDKYGDKKTEVITSVLANQFFGKTTNPKTAERISKLYGKHDQEFINTSTSKSRGHSTGGTLMLGSDSKGKTVSQSTVIQERDRVKPQELGGLLTGEFLGLLVDSDYNEFKGRLIEGDYPVEPIEEFNKVTSSMVKKNYQKIKEEASAILTGNVGDGKDGVYVSLEE
ncbi:MAG: type IV secretory system conjugative DNA transfer family protein [Bacteroidota bacterium]